MTGYSDRINHALAFAAKHHDHQVRKGTRAPYLTHPANVAIILTRYGQDESTVVAGILHDVVEDWIREGQTLASLQERVGEKFGPDVLEVLAQGYLNPALGAFGHGFHTVFPYLFMILFLMIRPYGMFGKRIIERV